MTPFRVSLALTFVCLFNIVYAQNLKKELSDTFYYSERWIKTGVKSAKFYRPPVKKEDDRCLVKFYTIDNKLYKKYLVKPVKLDYRYSIDPKVAIPDGAYTEYYPGGSIKKTGEYEHGKQIGTWKVFYEDSDQPEIIDFYYKNQPTVYYESYYESGLKRKEGIFLRTHIDNDTFYTKNGTWLYYFRSGGLSGLINYKMDVYQGYYVIYHSKDVKNQEGKYINGRRDSIWTFYDTTGLISRQGIYRSGNEDSIWVYYDINTRKIIMELLYQDGVLEGDAKYYYPSGINKSVGQFKNDNQQGLWTYYDSTGARIAEGKFENGERDSIWQYYDPVTQQVLAFITYDYGVLEGENVGFYRGGSKRFEINYHKNSGHIIRYDSVENNRIILQGDIEDDKRTGKWTEYYVETGSVKEDVTYKDGLLDGKAYHYEKDGKISIELNYNKGKLEGKSVYYFPYSEKVWMECKFGNGLLTSLKTFHNNGELKRKAGVKSNGTKYSYCNDVDGNEIDCDEWMSEAEFSQDVMVYISKNLRYPATARQKGVQGKVEVAFMVNESGFVKDAYVLNGINEDLNAEALRLVSQMPPWQPMKIDGVPISSSKVLPVVFWLPDSD